MAREEEIRVLLGNAAIARGLVEAGCHVVASYPGTPSSEIVPAVVRFKEELGLNMHIEWSANEKVAYDNALAASVAGKRAAVAMKQVGLNVASDSLMSSAYTGVKGGLVVISCDDPGPHSSQTEQDSRFFAWFAKVPAYDPSSAQEAKEMVKDAFELSEEFEIPVIVRPAIRVCHAKQSTRLLKPQLLDRPADFVKDPERWAATPRHRLLLHRRVNEALEGVRQKFERDSTWNYETFEFQKAELGIITCSVSFSICSEILDELGLKDVVPLMKIGTPHPLPQRKVADFIGKCESVLVVEETDAVIELQIVDKSKVLGRLTGHVPLQGELLPEIIHGILTRVLPESGLEEKNRDSDIELKELVESLGLPIRRPTLCAGCPERAAFFAIRKTFPKGIYASDIGCYTLGLNIGAVDTVIDMGAGITMASGFYQAYHLDGAHPSIIATMGDSTFYHAGTASLLSAVHNNARFILVILDNAITAMTGMQPTPGLGIRADGTPGKAVPLLELVKGCGVEWVRIADPYDITGFIASLKEANSYTQGEDGGVAVIIASHPCIIRYPEFLCENRVEVEITDRCNGCGYCIDYFECPGLRLSKNEKTVEIDRRLCVDCGVCISVCARGAIVPK